MTDGTLVVITGMSGAGRSLAAKALEDMGLFVVDNVPVEMIGGFVDMATSPKRQRDRLAIVMDSRSGLGLEGVEDALAEVEARGIKATLLYLDADDEELARRFAESRRPHPVPGAEVAESIAAERRAMGWLRERADIVIDTTGRSVPEFRALVQEAFADHDDDHTLRVLVESFGFKHGVPRIVDVLFDVRFLPNPHWVDQLRPLDGRDAAVRVHVLTSDGASEFLTMTKEMLAFLLPRYTAEGKSYLTIAVGCTGGRHRSVVLADELGDWLRGQGSVDVRVRHRDIDE